MNDFTAKNKQIIFISVLVLILVISFLFLPKVFSERYDKTQAAFAYKNSTSSPEQIVFTPSYIDTPDQVKGLYMTSWVAGTKSLRNGLIKIVDDTEINTVIIDIKDYSGKIAFSISDKKLRSFGSEEVRIPDMQEFIEELHKKGIYVVARIAVFQDAYFVKYRPDLAVKNKSGTSVWKDRKGISWIDAGAREYWDYILLLSQEARKVGFDEINFDYIRFPSDGNMQDISFPWSSTTQKTVVLEEFFKYLDTQLADSGVKTSADLFGMVTTATDDMGIGQLLEIALPYFDYISPMVYPSHYPLSFNGYKDPEAHPYEIIKYTMQSAIDRAELLSSTTGKTVGELRPWLQDFGLRMKYGPSEVKAQIQAVYDIGLDSWMLWSASNKYTTGALEAEKGVTSNSY